MDTFVVSVCPLDPDSSDFGDVCALFAPFLHQLTMQSSLFERGCPVLVVVCVARKLRPSYSRRRDRINLGLWRSLYKGGAGYTSTAHLSEQQRRRFSDFRCFYRSSRKGGKEYEGLGAQSPHCPTSSLVARNAFLLLPLLTVRRAQGQGCIGRGGGVPPPPPLQGTQPMPSHCLPNSRRRLEWRWYRQ